MSSTLILRSPLSIARRWPLVVLAILLPLWCAGTLYRGSWTPDEPREADIVWHMANQTDRTLPNFAGAPFLEKPPLVYWAAAQASRWFGDSIRASRVPNLLYAAVAVFALGALAFAMAGTEAALLTSLLAGTTLLTLRVSIWLAPDACLIAACTVALLGAYLGYVAKPGFAKLSAYTLMHVAAAIGFMAKSAPGWIVPALALLTLIAWERRWSELRRPELYAGALLQAVIIVPWLVSVWRAPDGAHALRVLFLDNLLGRFSTMSSADGTAYSAGHQNWFGRYLVELPFSLLPWTLLVVAALRTAWAKFRSGTLSTPWRFALASSVPFIALLSIASTARDIYAAPAVPGLALLVALWILEPDTTPGRFARFAINASRTLVLVIAVVLALATALIAAANSEDFIDVFVLPALIALLPTMCLLKAHRLGASGEHVGGLVATIAAFAISVLLASVSAFPAIDRWQDLPAMGRAIHRDSAGQSLALLQPDETTLAMLDDSLRSPPLAIRAADAPNWLCSHAPDARLLVMLPGHAAGEITRFLGRWWHEKALGDGDAAVLERSGVAKLLTRYALPHGRRYALMSPASAACDHETAAVESP